VAVAIIIVVILAVGAASMLLLATRRHQSVGELSRETISRDASDLPAVTGPYAQPSTDLEATGRVRSEETQAGMGSDLERRRGGGVVVYEPVDEEELGVTRRQFLNRALLTSIGFAAAAFGATLLAFLWPTNTKGFGGKFAVGSVNDILEQIAEKGVPAYFPDARAYVEHYPKDALPASKSVKAYQDPAIKGGLEQGIVTLYQKCVHLGCRVPFCPTSQWFECPCHGSKYNRVGQKKAGPAPRGLDLFGMEINGGNLTINTGILVQGPPIGTDTTKQQQEGPFCV
jgi:cytochrome b6-f complex iron-sulfur subunit